MLRRFVLVLLALPLTSCSLAAGNQDAAGGTPTRVAEAGPTSTSATATPRAAASSAGSAPISGGPLHVVVAPPSSPPPIDTMAEKAVNQASPSVILVKTGNALGSGVIVTSNGYIVTNDHVVKGASHVTVTLATGKTVTAQIRGTDPLDDLAVLKISASHLPAATFADSSGLEVGQTVLAVGNPLGITRTVTEGIVSAVARTVTEGQGGGRIPNAIQTSAPINPGNSGGALVNLFGEVVGIPTLTAVDPEFNAPASGIGFAIPSNKVISITTQVIKTGKVTHTGQAALGIRAADVTSEMAQQYGLPINHGVLVVSTVANGAAAKAGLRGGDIIVGVAGHTVASESDLLDILAKHQPGDAVSVTYVTKGGQHKTALVTLGELSANATS